MCLEGRSPLFLYFIATRDMLVAMRHATSLLTPRGCSRHVFAVAPTPQHKPPAPQANHPGAARGYNSAIPQCRLEILNTISVPTPYQPETCVASCSDFALRRNPRMQRRWYGDGTTMVRRISGDAPWLGAKVGAAVPCVTGRSGDTGDPAFAGVAEKTPVMRAVFFVTTSSTPPFSI